VTAPRAKGHPTTKDGPGRTSGLGLGVGALLMLLCCAGPALVGAGVFGAVGGGLGQPPVVALLVGGAATALVAVVRRRSATGRQTGSHRPHPSRADATGDGGTRDAR
jgi:hypothetical protein